MPPYLPPYQNTAAYSQAPVAGSEYLNTGNLGFRNLGPVVGTSGGFENNIWNPKANPYPGGFSDPEGYGLTPDFNPFTQGYMSGGKWNPYLPGKIMYGQVDTNLGAIPGGGGSSQWVGGKQVNIGANNYGAGTDAPAPYQFGVSAGDARMEAAPPVTGFGFGQVGQPGYRFMPGTLEGGKIYADQPATLNPTPQAGLGTFKPWPGGNPAIEALQQQRKKPT